MISKIKIEILGQIILDKLEYNKLYTLRTFHKMINQDGYKQSLYLTSLSLRHLVNENKIYMQKFYRQINIYWKK